MEYFTRNICGYVRGLVEIERGKRREQEIEEERKIEERERRGKETGEQEIDRAGR